MRNIFKTFKENQKLLEENKILKAQNEALVEFRKSFDNYYKDISGVKFITKNYDKHLTLQASVSMDRENMYCPTDICKERIARELAQQLMPVIEYDVADNRAYGTKEIVGRLTVLTR